MNKIGIILVNYNGYEDTIACINSINKSSYKDYFIVVIDNNSKESFGDYKEFPNVIYKRLNENVGFGIANNIGAELAIREGASHILCLNNDTEIKTNTLAKLLEKSDKKTITTAAIYYYSNKNELWYGGGEISKFKGKFVHKQYKSDKEISFISGCCMLIPVNCIKDIGLFEKEYFMYYEDADFSIKALNNGYRLYYVYDAVVFHKVGKTVNKENGIKDYYLTRNRLYILKKYKNYFGIFSHLYFWITRTIMLLVSAFLRRNTKPFVEGIKDYKLNLMGKKI